MQDVKPLRLSIQQMYPTVFVKCKVFLNLKKIALALLALAEGSLTNKALIVRFWKKAKVSNAEKRDKAADAETDYHQLSASKENI